MKLSGIPLKGFRISKEGKIIRETKHLDISTRLKQRASKKIKVGKK